MDNSKGYWKSVLEEAQRERSARLLKRLELDATAANIEIERESNEEMITQLDEAIEHTAKLAGENPPYLTEMIEGLASVPLAQACREVLKSKKKGWSAIEVRNELLSQNYDLSTHNNALASIHSVLKRFAEAKDVAVTGEGGGRLYRWKEKPNYIVCSADGEQSVDRISRLIEEKVIGKTRNHTILFVNVGSKASSDRLQEEIQRIYGTVGDGPIALFSEDGSFRFNAGRALIGSSSNYLHTFKKANPIGDENDSSKE